MVAACKRLNYYLHTTDAMQLISSLNVFQCYYIGGLEESATSIVSELAKPVSWGMPSDKICYKLYIKDQQICDLKYGKCILFILRTLDPFTLCN